jgi:hypothetical protein
MGGNSATFAAYIANTDRIYVMGHCSPGALELTTESGRVTGVDEVCRLDELVQIFQRHGLPQASQVHIRIHACNSATSQPAGANNSFAERFKADMVAAGFRQITVRGYDRAVGVYFGWRWAGTSAANKYAVDF